MENKQIIEGNSTQSGTLKKRLKSDVNRISAAVILHSLIMAAVIIAGMVVRPVVAALRSDSSDIMKAFDEIVDNKAFWQKASESGIEYLIFSVLGVFAVWLIMRKKVSRDLFFEKNQTMNARSCLKCIIILMGIQLPTVLFDSAVELGLNQFGLTTEKGLEAAASGSLTVSMFLYSSIAGPIAEELIFRGFVMRGLQKYGKPFAIVISSVLFGVMHQNLVQSVFAIGAGLILGYVAMRYSIKWSVLLHIINNCVFGDLLLTAISGLPEDIQYIIVWGIELAFFALACIIIIKERKRVKEEIGACGENKKYYGYAFSSLLFLAFIVVSTVLSFQVIEKI